MSYFFCSLLLIWFLKKHMVRLTPYSFLKYIPDNFLSWLVTIKNKKWCEKKYEPTIFMWKRIYKFRSTLSQRSLAIVRLTYSSHNYCAKGSLPSFLCLTPKRRLGNSLLQKTYNSQGVSDARNQSSGVPSLSGISDRLIYFNTFQYTNITVLNLI